MFSNDVAYERLTAQGLDPLAVVAQCLDNQWVPRTLLAEMVTKGQTLNDVADVREGLVRGEYLRALLTARQVVINRAFIYNSGIISRDLREGGHRKAFVELLRSRAIVPFLFKESSPLERPDFGVDDEGFEGWVSACHEAGDLACLRLAWDDDRNDDFAANLGVSFHNFITTAYTRGLGERIGEFGRHLGIREPAYEDFRGRLLAMRRWATQVEEDHGRTVTREEVYRQFVVPDGAAPRLGLCDPGKPFAAELKQLVDLQYNTSLPEYLDRLPLRPSDTLHRAALREPVPPRGGLDMASEEDCERTLQTRLAFDAMSDDLDPLDTPYLLDLDLRAVAAVRQTEQWKDYVRQLTSLIEGREPGDFETFADPLIERFGEVLRLLGNGRRTHKWLMQRRALLDVAGIGLRVLYGAKPKFQVIGEINVAAVRSLATVRFALVNQLRGMALHKEPNLAVDTLRTYVDDPKVFIAKMRTGLKQAGFAELDAVPTEGRLRPASIEKDLAGGYAM
jgi:hypothetical protein